MKKLFVPLILWIVVPTVFAQSDEQARKDRDKFVGWLGIVKKAERNFKATHGRYGDLDDLRKAHLLDALIFESDSSTLPLARKLKPKTISYPRARCFK
jgi:hypothetical protein